MLKSKLAVLGGLCFVVGLTGSIALSPRIATAAPMSSLLCPNTACETGTWVSDCWYGDFTACALDGCQGGVCACVGTAPC